MARFHGEVGYGDSVETAPGVWEDIITEVPYFGDVTRDARNLEPGEGANPNINVSNSISIVADKYAFDNFLNIKYVKWMGVLWTVTNVEVQRPRLLLSIGSRYNGPTP